MQRDNRNWNNSVSDKKILEKTINIGYLINTNTHIPFLNSLKDIVLCDYKVLAKFIYKGYNGDDIICNGRTLAYRPHKLELIKYAKNVYLKEGKPLKSSGSNKYPTVRYIDNWCILEFISNGLPIIDEINGWDIHILQITKL